MLSETSPIHRRDPKRNSMMGLAYMLGVMLEDVLEYLQESVQKSFYLTRKCRVRVPA